MSQRHITKPSIENQAAMFETWNNRYRKHTYDEVGEEIIARADRSLEYLQSLHLDRPRILEIGCGTGWLTAKLCEVGTVWACDLGEAAVEYARGRGLDVELVVGNVVEMDFPKADVAIVFDTLFYVEEQAKLIDMLADKVEWLIISNLNAWVFERCAELQGPEPGQYSQWLSIKKTRQLLSSRLRVLRLETVHPFWGNVGIMRLVQSYKLNHWFRWLPLERMKNAMKLGAGVVVLAQRR